MVHSLSITRVGESVTIESLLSMISLMIGLPLDLGVNGPKRILVVYLLGRLKKRTSDSLSNLNTVSRLTKIVSYLYLLPSMMEERKIKMANMKTIHSRVGS